MSKVFPREALATTEAKILQQGTNIPEGLLNKPYVNDVTLRGQNPSLKRC